MAIKSYSAPLPIVVTLKTGEVLLTVKSENNASDGPSLFMHMTVQLMASPTRAGLSIEQFMTDKTVGYERIAIAYGLPPEIIASFEASLSVTRNDDRSKFGAVMENVNMAPVPIV